VSKKKSRPKASGEEVRGSVPRTSSLSPRQRELTQRVQLLRTALAASGATVLGIQYRNPLSAGFYYTLAGEMTWVDVVLPGDVLEEAYGPKPKSSAPKFWSPPRKGGGKAYGPGDLFRPHLPPGSFTTLDRPGEVQYWDPTDKAAGTRYLAQSRRPPPLPVEPVGQPWGPGWPEEELELLGDAAREELPPDWWRKWGK
jgi:hypothetical protein